ncbi:hypothetical protein EVAR_100111_1 [Eumeta japonica]|uniref:Uncharacterized protein n=1 Tax=Eumeta variegata TaxID=151549 RepID=A0A4C1YSN4_EUMVA|nr:hypothetical protein EVAR_100111_1 [Eumeta japonica]
MARHQVNRGRGSDARGLRRPVTQTDARPLWRMTEPNFFAFAVDAAARPPSEPLNLKYSFQRYQSDVGTKSFSALNWWRRRVSAHGASGAAPAVVVQ